MVAASPLLGRAGSWHEWLFSPSGPKAGAALLVGGTRGLGDCLQGLGGPRAGTSPLVGGVVPGQLNVCAYGAFIFIFVSSYVTCLFLFSVTFKVFSVLGFEQFGLMSLGVIFFISFTWGSLTFDMWVHSFHKIWKF